MWKLALVFNWVDWVILLILFWFLLRGFQRGMLVALGKSLRIATVLFGSLVYFMSVAKAIEQVTLIPLVYAKILAFFGLAVASYLFVWLLGKLFSFLVKIQFTSWVDRLGGIFFGGVHYSLVLGFLLFTTMLLPVSITHRQVYQDSFVGKKVARFWVKQYQKLATLVPFYAEKPRLSDFGEETLTSSVHE